MLREAWNPATVLDSNMTLQRDISFSYYGVVASAVETVATGDNNNNEEVFLDGKSTGHQSDCGSIFRFFTGITPVDVKMNVHS